MDSMKSTQSGIQAKQQTTPSQPQSATLQEPEKKPLTFKQRLADSMAAKVGSWGFLIGQSTVLVGWISCNLMPGVPHWDQSPFILLNLMFSFASAYTAPVVLMSQNRQSEEDRESANQNYQITLQAAQKLELLHEKLDIEYARKLDELSELIKQQQAASQTNVVVPAQTTHQFEHESHKVTTLSFLNTLPGETIFVSAAKNLDDIEVRIKH